MFSKVLLVASAILSYGSNLTLKAPEKAYNPVNNSHFLYFTDVFPNYTYSWSGDRLSVLAVIDNTSLLALPDYSFNYFYFGDFYVEFEINALTYYILGQINETDDHVDMPPSEHFPFSNTNSFNIYDKYYFMQLGTPLTYELFFEFSSVLTESQRPFAVLSFINNFGFANENAVSDYIETIAYDNYNEGYKEGESTASGGWLGNLVFGTIGGIVGLLFAISDFEVLGVSIMSIITLFVAIGIIILLIKVIK